MFTKQLKFSFLFSHKFNTEISLHQHDCYELVYYLRGSGTTTIDNTAHTYSENTFSIIQPRTYHNELHHEATELICLGFPFRESESHSIRLENGIYPDRSCLLLQLVKKMKYELLTQRIHHHLKLELLLNEFLIEFERTRSIHSSTESFEYIENFINENFQQQINLPSLANLSGYSYDHFRHLFKVKTGEPPMSYIINKRIQHAKKMMLSTDMSMSTISQDCGFSNSSQFSDTFRKITGFTPSEFKRKHFIR
ncbi:AraC family transcriptional activator of pobA [Paenibacillus baekrokdamisoli]|uniref:helix-turn-helix transcriptional regulator n=1 Tax=Paenibacillus baekrokdamisoli TaxID=1712516 RepID=UPI0013E0AEFD|nr:AraC family transcriptional regulator [Paenibacillus baekrokdamisoli]MBB3071924.1 AraC family transcriptional activator of pobA [Paenibacillus baekrokdamisoli]